MKKVMSALSGLGVLLALGLLLLALFWLVMHLPGWLFAMRRGVHVWVVIAAALALVGTSIAWLVSSRPTPAAKGKAAVAAAAALVVQPLLAFLVGIGILALLRIVDPNMTTGICKAPLDVVRWMSDW